MKIDEMIVVLQAFRDGKAIQYAARNCDPRKWIDVPGRDPVWNFASYEYRVKPEPRVFWVPEYENCSLGQMYSSKEAAVGNAKYMGGFKRVIKLVEQVEPS